MCCFDISPRSIAASMMGAHHIVGVDCDQDALDLAWVNMKKLEIDNLDLIKCDLNGGLLKLGINGMTFTFYHKKSHSCGPSLLVLEFDTIIMNPPFGTRNTGIDSIFLLNAMRISSVVYSLHKTSTREVTNQTISLFACMWCLILLGCCCAVALWPLKFLQQFL